MITVWWTVAKLSHSWGEKHIALDSRSSDYLSHGFQDYQKCRWGSKGDVHGAVKIWDILVKVLTWCSWPKRVGFNPPNYQKLWCWSTHFWRVKIIISTIVLLFYYILKYWGYECIYSPALYNFYVEKYRGTIHTKYTPLSSRHKRIS